MKSRAEQAEREVTSIQERLEKYQDDMAVMAARKRDLARLGQLTEEHRAMEKKLSYLQ